MQDYFINYNIKIFFSNRNIWDLKFAPPFQYDGLRKVGKRIRHVLEPVPIIAIGFSPEFKPNHQLLGKLFLHGQGSGWDKVIRGGIVILASWKYHFIREAKKWCNIQVILYPFLEACTNLYVLVAKLLFISSVGLISFTYSAAIWNIQQQQIFTLFDYYKQNC